MTMPPGIWLFCRVFLVEVSELRVEGF
jgi:hypothetical protein